MFKAAQGTTWQMMTTLVGKVMVNLLAVRSRVIPAAA